jgi:hypothetical protein
LEGEGIDSGHLDGEILLSNEKFHKEIGVSSKGN